MPTSPRQHTEFPSAGQDDLMFGGLPPVDDDSFMFSDSQPFAAGYAPLHPEAPLTLASQARTLEWALEQMHGTGEVIGDVAYAQQWTHDMAQATLVANTSESAAEISELEADPRCQTVVFIDGGRMVIGPSLEAETSAIIDLSIGDIKAVQSSYLKVAALPGDKSKGGSGAEILDILPEEAKGIAVDALRAMVRHRKPSAELFTHSADEGADTAGEYFAKEAGVMLRSAGYLPAAGMSGRLVHTVRRANLVPQSIRRVSALAMSVILHR